MDGPLHLRRGQGGFGTLAMVLEASEGFDCAWPSVAECVFWVPSTVPQFLYQKSGAVRLKAEFKVQEEVWNF